MIILQSSTQSTFPLHLEWNIPDDTTGLTFSLHLTDDFSIKSITYSLVQTSRDLRFINFQLDSTIINPDKRWFYQLKLDDGGVNANDNVVSNGILKIKI